jgi:HSP20 family protein
MSNNITNIKKEVPVKAEPHGFFQEMEERMQEFERNFESLFQRDWVKPMRLEFPEWTRHGMLELKTPKVDIIERDNDILVRAEIAGVKKEDLDVSLTESAITIKGSTSEEIKEEKAEYFRSETMKGEFSRTLALPAKVDGSKAESKYKDGMLEVVVPKLEKARRHKVTVT